MCKIWPFRVVTQFQGRSWCRSQFHCHCHCHCHSKRCVIHYRKSRKPTNVPRCTCDSCWGWSCCHWKRMCAPSWWDLSADTTWSYWRCCSSSCWCCSTCVRFNSIRDLSFFSFTDYSTCESFHSLLHFLYSPRFKAQLWKNRAKSKRNRYKKM